MKQGTNFHLPVEVEIDLEKVEKIEFVFSQNKDGNVCKRNVYPDNCERKKEAILF